MSMDPEVPARYVIVHLDGHYLWCGQESGFASRHTYDADVFPTLLDLPYEIEDNEGNVMRLKHREDYGGRWIMYGDAYAYYTFPGADLHDQAVVRLLSSMEKERFGYRRTRSGAWARKY